MLTDKEKRNAYMREWWSSRKERESELHYKREYGVFWECKKIIDLINKEIVRQYPDKVERNKMRCAYERDIMRKLKKKCKFKYDISFYKYF